MFRFLIRDVLWLTVVVALGICWYVAGQRAAQLQTENAVLTKKAKDAERLHKIGSENLLRSTSERLSAVAERKLAEKFWAEARLSKGLPLDPPR